MCSPIFTFTIIALIADFTLKHINDMRSKIFVIQSLNNFTVLVLQHCVWPITYFLTSFFAWYVKYFFIGGGVFREAACFTERIYLLLFLTNSYIPDWYLTIYFFMLFSCFVFVFQNLCFLICFQYFELIDGNKESKRPSAKIAYLCHFLLKWWLWHE